MSMLASSCCRERQRKDGDFSIARGESRRRDWDFGLRLQTYTLSLKGPADGKSPEQDFRRSAIPESKTGRGCLSPGGAFPPFDIAAEGWCSDVNALTNEIAERCSRFQTPLLPR